MTDPLQPIMNAAQVRLNRELDKIAPGTEAIIVAVHLPTGAASTSSRIEHRAAAFALVSLAEKMLRSVNAGPWWREKPHEPPEAPKRPLKERLARGVAFNVVSFITGAGFVSGLVSMALYASIRDWPRVSLGFQVCIWAGLAWFWSRQWSKAAKECLSALETAALYAAQNAQLATILHAQAQGEAEVSLLPMPEETAH